MVYTVCKGPINGTLGLNGLIFFFRRETNDFDNVVSHEDILVLQEGMNVLLFNFVYLAFTPFLDQGFVSFLDIEHILDLLLYSETVLIFVVKVILRSVLKLIIKGKGNIGEKCI